MKTIAYERYNFHKLEQSEDETTSDWVARLIRQAKFCNFADTESQIFDKIVEKTTIRDLRQKVFNQEMNLNELMALARSMEEKNGKKKEKCHRCGFDDHFAYDVICPAKNKRCDNCSILGHFAKMCFKPARKRPSAYEDMAALPNHERPKRMRMEEKLEMLERKKEIHEDAIKKETPSSDRPNVKSNEMADTRKNSVEKGETFNEINQRSTSNTRKAEKSFSARIGDVTTRAVVSDDYAVNVISKKFFDTHKIKCTIHTNKETIINGVKYSKALGTRVEKNGVHSMVDFYFSEEIEEEKCIIQSHIAKNFFK